MADANIKYVQPINKLAGAIFAKVSCALRHERPLKDFLLTANDSSIGRRIGKWLIQGAAS